MPDTDNAFTKIDKNWNNDETTRPHVKHQTMNVGLNTNNFPFPGCCSECGITKH